MDRTINPFGIIDKLFYNGSGSTIEANKLVMHDPRWLGDDCHRLSGGSVGGDSRVAQRGRRWRSCDWFLD